MSGSTPFDYAANELAVMGSRIEQFATPGALALALNRETVQTPALDLIDEALVDIARWMDGDLSGDDRLIISLPPQQGKSERITHYGAEWFLQRNPELRIALTSYGDEVVRAHSYAIRNDAVTFDGTEEIIKGNPNAFIYLT